MATPRHISTSLKEAPCGHMAEVEHWTNDRGEPQDMERIYDHPETGNPVCMACYDAAMQKLPQMSMSDLVRAFSGR